MIVVILHLVVLREVHEVAGLEFPDILGLGPPYVYHIITINFKTVSAFYLDPLSTSLFAFIHASLKPLLLS